MKSIVQMMKSIEAHQIGVAKRRDQLDKFIDELEGFRQSCDEAWDHLQDAREALSQYV